MDTFADELSFFTVCRASGQCFLHSFTVQVLNDATDREGHRPKLSRFSTYIPAVHSNRGNVRLVGLDRVALHGYTSVFSVSFVTRKKIRNELVRYDLVDCILTLFFAV